MTERRLNKLFGEKIVYISGASSGIGLACAELLVAHAAQLVLIARDVQRLDAAKRILRKHPDARAEVQTVSVDVSDGEKMALLLSETIRRAGAPDVVLHSAGYAFPASFVSFDDERMRYTFDVNVIGTWNVLRCLAPSLGSGAVVVVLSSFAALLGIYGYSAYTASKCAVLGFCEVLRNELVLNGVAVKVVCPADVDTPQLEYENRHKPAQTKAISGAVRPYSAAYVAKYILSRVYRYRFLIIPGFYPKIIWLVKRLLPSLVYRMVDRALIRYHASH